MDVVTTSAVIRRSSRREFLWRNLCASLVFYDASKPALAGQQDKLDRLPITGLDNRDLAGFDRLMTSFVKEQRAPGAALAVTLKQRLVYARGFGFADKDKKAPVEPDALFRIASISKPFTAAAILCLTAQNKLRLTDKVTDIVKFKPLLEKDAEVDPRLHQVTILQLLQHTGGWDRDKSFDPMFRSFEIASALKVPPPAYQEHIIRYMFGKPLDFEPGTRDAYSNFGYCLLGEVIRQVSGQSYEDYVRKEILLPLGIKQMQLGKSLVPAPKEVQYYDEKNRQAPAVMGDRLGQPVPSPYGSFCLEAMDAHGGWIASTIDLVRFAAALDDPRRCPFLPTAAFPILYGRTFGLAGFEANGRPRDVFYGCGWFVRMQDAVHGNAWHPGAMEGSSTLLVRRQDGLNWAVLFNTFHGPDGKQLCDLIDPKIHEVADRVRTWPKYDLFNKFGLSPAVRAR